MALRRISALRGVFSPAQWRLLPGSRPSGAAAKLPTCAVSTLREAQGSGRRQGFHAFLAPSVGPQHLLALRERQLSSSARYANEGVVVEGRLAGVEAEIAKVNLQIDAVGAEIAKVGNKLEAIDSQLKQLMSGEVPENMKSMVAFQVRRQHSKDPEEAFNAAVDVLIADLNKDKENLNKDKDRLAHKEQDLRKEKERLSEEKAVLLGKLPGDGNVTADSILTEEVLDKAVWQKNVVPAMTHSLKPHPTEGVAVSGETVKYVLPAIFYEAWGVIQGEAYFHETTMKKHLGKDFIKLIIDGASGCGKTRIGLELYKKLEAEKKKLGHQRVRYVYMDCHSLMPHDRDIFAFFLRNFSSVRGVNEVPRALREMVACSMLGLAEGERGVLLLHIDEFSLNPELVKYILDSLVDYHGEERRALVLPVCTGLYAGEGVLTHLSPTDSKRILTMPYFDSTEATLQLVRNAAKAYLREVEKRTNTAAGPKPLSRLLDEPSPPAILRYLVEDMDGWAMAAVQLGAHLSATQWDETKDGLLRETLGGVEAALMNQLGEKYTTSLIARSLGVTDVGAWKLAALALSPLPVSWAEPLNGSNLQESRKYGILNLELVDETLYRVRLSRPLLRILTQGSKFFEHLLHHMAPTALLNGMNPNDLLRTCRPQFDREVEVVQLLSWVVTYYTWLIMEDRTLSPRRVSLHDLRPGAQWSGGDCPSATALMKAARGAVNTFANGMKPGTELITTRHDIAVKYLPALVARVSKVKPGAMGLSADKEAALDAWCYPTAGANNGFVLLMQAKGVTKGSAAGMAGRTGVIEDTKLTSYVTKAAEAWAVWSKKSEPAPVEVVLELLENHGANRALEPTGPLHAVAFISQNELKTALGYVFGGIAARCQEMPAQAERDGSTLSPEDQSASKASIASISRSLKPKKKTVSGKAKKIDENSNRKKKKLP